MINSPYLQYCLLKGEWKEQNWEQKTCYSYCNKAKSIAWDTHNSEANYYYL